MVKKGWGLHKKGSTKKCGHEMFFLRYLRMGGSFSVISTGILTISFSARKAKRLERKGQRRDIR